MKLIQNVEVKEERLSLRQLMAANEETEQRDQPLVLSKQFTVLRPTPPTPPRRPSPPITEEQLELTSSSSSTGEATPIPSYRATTPTKTPTGQTPTPKCSGDVLYQQAQMNIRRESRKSEARDSMVYSSDGSDLEGFSPFNCKNLAATDFQGLSPSNLDCVDSGGSSGSSGLRLPIPKIANLPTDSSCFDSSSPAKSVSTPAFIPRLDFKAIQQVQSIQPLDTLPMVPSSSSHSVSSGGTSQPFMRYDKSSRRLVPSHSNGSRHSFASSTISVLHYSIIICAYLYLIMYFRSYQM